MDLKQNVINKLNLEFGKDVKCIGRSHDIYKKLQEEKSSIEKSVNYENVQTRKKCSCSWHLSFTNQNWHQACINRITLLRARSKGVFVLVEIPQLMTCTKFEVRTPPRRYHHNYVYVMQYVGRRYMYHAFNWNSGELNLRVQFFARFAKMRKVISVLAVLSIRQVVCPVLGEWISSFM